MSLDREYANKLAKQIRNVMRKHIANDECARCNSSLKDIEFNILMKDNTFYALCYDCSLMYVMTDDLVSNINERN